MKSTNMTFSSHNRKIYYLHTSSKIQQVQLAMKKGLGGVMVWSIDTDDFRGDCALNHHHHKHNRIIDPRDHQYPIMQAITLALERDARGHASIYQPICLPLLLIFTLLTCSHSV